MCRRSRIGESLMSKFAKTVNLIQTEGAPVALRYCASYVGYKILGKRLLSIEDILYQRWRRENLPSAADFETMRAEAAALTYQPLVCIIMPVYDVDAALLRRAVQSVENQIYPNWALCIVDDCSTRTDTTAELERLAMAGGRMSVRRLASNAGIAAASNVALESAEGEFIALLDHDDELSPDALFEMVKLLNAHPDTDMVYSDEDKLDERARHVEAFLKPDWSPELLLSNMYTCQCETGIAPPAGRAIPQQPGSCSARSTPAVSSTVGGSWSTANQNSSWCSTTHSSDGGNTGGTGRLNQFPQPPIDNSTTRLRWLSLCDMVRATMVLPPRR